jgi:phosphoserine phosphatase
LRLAAAFPAPFALSDYEPFRPLGTGAFCTSVVQDLSEEAFARLKVAMAKAFDAGATAGYCLAPSVKAVFFDMDATVIAEESLVEIAAHAGKAAEVAVVTERAMAGELDFGQALAARVALLEGLPADVLDKVAGHLTLNRGIQPFVAFCREIGVPSFLVSGGFTHLAEVVRRKVGFAAVRANVLGIADGKLTGRVEGDIVDGQGKRAFLLATCARLGIAPEDAAAVGDGANDIPMLQAAGVAVGYKPKDVLLPHVHAVNRGGNHAFLAPLLFGRDLAITRSR